MTTENDYDFFDALDRLEIDFEDFATIDILRERLTQVLGGFPSARQEEMALFHLGHQASQTRMEALSQGLDLTFFTRRGQGVATLRDARGRFVTEGAENITSRLRRGAG